MVLWCAWIAAYALLQYAGVQQTAGWTPVPTTWRSDISIGYCRWLWGVCVGGGGHALQQLKCHAR